jgi:hypothetical protein
MKDITFRADEHLIDQARRVARARNTTLNAAFRDWLREYVLCASRGRAPSQPCAGGGPFQPPRDERATLSESTPVFRYHALLAMNLLR